MKSTPLHLDIAPTSRTLAGDLAVYLAALACFLALDACWLGLVGPRLYEPLRWLVAPRIDAAAAILFYLVYVGGLQAFVIQPALVARRVIVALRRGAGFGVVAYATYDLTNQATVRAWPWTVTLADLAWGCAASATAAGVVVALALAWKGRGESRGRAVGAATSAR